MRPADRHDEIVRLVLKTGEISVDDLADRLGVSRETIRRDLTALDEMGKVRKFHGGARARSVAATEPPTEGPFAARMAENTAAKRRIAYAAASLLSPGDALFIDTGTTTLALAEALIGLPSLVIITNSCRVAATVSANPDHKVFLIGGAYGADAGESLGHLAVEQIGRFRARHAFLTVGAVDPSGVMDFDVQETQIAQAMMDRVELTTILADSSKFGRRGIFEVAPWHRVDRLVTDATPPEEITAALTAEGVDLLIPAP
ncbi:DeoR/GlpR family DNA-binding transcription regulator [Novispirillum itersonii]|uniref:DeoR/GlpR family DNA-binding transcription regulator n=1 Tax=Novispirillum itersonii TaxID=189 RepID=UPI00037504D5|nr:DeoR/GlpR family DNA-binding transcription regulator [Novispirillum itersonii]